MLSSVGRAAPLQGVGRGFEPLSTHQTMQQKANLPFAFFIAVIHLRTQRVSKHVRFIPQVQQDHHGVLVLADHPVLRAVRCRSISE
ncbi:hypothetical protein VARIO8X_90707 [Burkholderiales bacterium 8X]|nr:hypothetical protein VARIO8X_90707 [Burkholderiales bacterium 8X]